VSEGTGENLFMVRDDVVYTTPIAAGILQGITRATMLQIAADLGIRAEQKPLPREMLYTADELFFTGTAAEVTPIRSVDRIAVGTGRAGEITLRLQRRFMDIVHGRVPDDHGWLIHVRAVRAQPRLAS
jgi:branched-chain amino acid aminotransferase